MRAVPRLRELYPGICLTTEEKARNNLSQCSIVSIYDVSSIPPQYNIPLLLVWLSTVVVYCLQQLPPSRRHLLAWRFNSGRVLAFSTIPFHLRRSCTCSVHFMSFIFFKSFLTSSSHRDMGLPADLPVNGFYLCVFFTILVSLPPTHIAVIWLLQMMWWPP